MAKYLISWSVYGEFEVDAMSSSEAKSKFDSEWTAGAIQPRRDGRMSAGRPIELVTDEDD